MAFRMINETLYKSKSTEAHQLMHDDPKVFEEVCPDVLNLDSSFEE